MAARYSRRRQHSEYFNTLELTVFLLAVPDLGAALRCRVRFAALAAFIAFAPFIAFAAFIAFMALAVVLDEP